MEYGDAAIYVKDGKPLNALVVKHSGDTLNLLYLDPASESFVSQGNLAKIASTAIGARPLVEGGKFGWKEVSHLPSAADLDAVAEEKKAAEETNHTLASTNDSTTVSESQTSGLDAAAEADKVFGEVPAGDPESPHSLT